MRGLWGGALALLLLAPQAAPALQAPEAAAVQSFAPPVGQPLAYRVTTRRIGRDGSLMNFALVYALTWDRIGRGYQLKAVLQRIDSDAPPPVKRALTLMLEPLVGEEMTYLVAPDGSRIELVDPEGLWKRVTARVEAMGAGADRPEAKQLAQLLAALPAADRDRLATADIRALVAPANGSIPVAAEAEGASISMQDGATLRTIAKVERASVGGGAAAQPLEIDNLWTVDIATGLVVREQRQSWTVEAEGGERTLVEERVRSLEGAR